ncbi:MAG: SNF2-related protein [Alloprevotella sp.]
MPSINPVQRPHDMTLEEWQVALRRQQAEKESFFITQDRELSCPGEYRVTNHATQNEYKVVYRGKGSQWNYCSCMDFKTSQLGTCKHLEAVKLWVKTKRKKVHRDLPAYSSVYVDYKGPRCVKLRVGTEHADMMQRLAADFFDEQGVIRKEAYARFDIFLQAAKAIDCHFRCYGDALDYVIEQRERTRREQLADQQYTDDTLDKLLTVPLYPYQKEGIRFAIKAGRAIIADEMGLGKTVQAIATAQIYLNEGMADSVLVVCPTSLKYQWKKEIEKFTGGDTITCDLGSGTAEGDTCSKVIVIEGSPFKRQQLYKSAAPYKIVSYNTVCNDIRQLGSLSTDVLIIDEIQRLKNWNTLIAKAARKIVSRYAVLLSGTPLENKLEELYASMELADQFCLGPYYKFRDEHILLDPDKGSMVGYKNLNAVGEQIKDRLLRRTKKSVQLQLPKRSDQYILVPMTSAQADYHAEFKWELTKILGKYEKFHFMTEQDRRRLMVLLGQMRMVADSTFILEQNLKKRSDIKIAETMNLLDNVFANGDEKVVIFSEWERMTRLVAIELEKRGIRFEYLNGSVSAKQRGQIVEDFNTLPESRVFLSTDAGSTGLNLQAASTLINLDLPWNPAVLEQRAARIYRLGQERPVQILSLVSRGSIEEGMIERLRFKASMFEGVLDGGDDTVFVSEDKFKKFMDDLSCVMNDTPQPPAVDYIDDKTEENSVPTPEAEPDTMPGERVKGRNEPPAPMQPDERAEHDTHPIQQAAAAPPRNPRQLIHQGISFLSGLAETLQSPESTRQLIDHLVEVDEKTGEANIKIPVADKETVMQMFSLLGKFLQR